MVEEHAGCETAGIGVMQKFSPFPKPPFKISVFNKLCQVCFIRRLQQGVCVVCFFLLLFHKKRAFYLRYMYTFVFLWYWFNSSA